MENAASDALLHMRPGVPHLRTGSSYEAGVDGEHEFKEGHRDGVNATGDGGADDAALAEMLRGAGGPTSWRAISAHAAPGHWRDLRDWVEWFRVEFGLDHRVVPPCWYLHRALVNVLSALRDHWLSAYDPMGSPLGPADWHRGLMPLEMRLREWASRTGCTIGEHRADVSMVYPPDDEVWAAHVAADVAARARRDRRGPTNGPALDIALALTPPPNGRPDDQ